MKKDWKKPQLNILMRLRTDGILQIGTCKNAVAGTIGMKDYYNRCYDTNLGSVCIGDCQTQPNS